MDTSNDANLWSLDDGQNVFAAAEAGVTDIVRRRAAGGTETCQLQVGGEGLSAPPRFAPGSTVRILRAGVSWFVGRVTGVPGEAGGGGRTSVYQLSGPWWYLEELVCQQEWTLRDGAGVGTVGRLILGQAADGSPLHSGQIVTEALQYAIDAGAPFEIGTVEPCAFLPLDEVRDVTCAEVIRRTLRWHPDHVAWFDHASAPVPTFHCCRRGNLPAVTFTVGKAPLAEVCALSAWPGGSAPAVVLHYEAETNGGIDVLTAAAPAGATGREFGALVATIPLGDAERQGGGTGTEPGSAGAPEPGTGGETDGSLLAQTLLDERSGPRHGGSLILVEAVAGGTAAGLGTTLNLAGAVREGWETMGEAVVEEEVCVARGTTTLRFGPTEEERGLAAALRLTRSGVEGREPGSPAVEATPGSAARVSGRVPVGGGRGV